MQILNNKFNKNPTNNYIQNDHKLFTAFRTYINQNVLEMMSVNGFHFWNESLKFFMLNDLPADSGAAETYRADERKMAVSLQ
jgi:hypothetical protein